MNSKICITNNVSSNSSDSLLFLSHLCHKQVLKILQQDFFAAQPQMNTPLVASCTTICNEKKRYNISLGNASSFILYTMLTYMNEIKRTVIEAQLSSQILYESNCDHLKYKSPDTNSKKLLRIVSFAS
jgi:hypothetical protein